VYNYDDLYGIGLSEYCSAHDITLSKLKQKIITDIELLSNRLRILATASFHEQDISLINTVHKLISKKSKHLDRLQNWSDEI